MRRLENRRSYRTVCTVNRRVIGIDLYEIRLLSLRTHTRREHDSWLRCSTLGDLLSSGPTDVHSHLVCAHPVPMYPPMRGEGGGAYTRRIRRDRVAECGRGGADAAEATATDSSSDGRGRKPRHATTVEATKVLASVRGKARRCRAARPAARAGRRTRQCRQECPRRRPHGRRYGHAAAH